MKKLISLSAVAATFLFGSVTLASTGTLTGEFVFTQKQENCGTGTGAKYPCSEKGLEAKVRRAKVEVRNPAGTVIGTGYTGTNGQWSVGWNDPSTTGNVTVTLRWRSVHQDGRFQVTNSSGALWAFNVSGTFNAVKNTTTPIGKVNWGANDLANVYDGATKMWENSLSQSNRMNNHFGTFAPPGAGATSYVQIRTNVDDGSCPTGLAMDNLNRICLPTSGLLMNQSRVMHEMGHIASFRSTRDQTAFLQADYTFGGTGGWDPTSAEWHSVQFTEGVATALANVALYQQNASEPRTCIQAATCPTNNGTNLEATPTSCTTTNRRSEQIAEKYFWDIYDSTSDGNDALAMGMWHITDTIHAFDPGGGNRQKSEATMSDPDGHSTLDFVNNWIIWGTNSTAILTQNCAPTTAGADTATTTCGATCPAPD